MATHTTEFANHSGLRQGNPMAPLLFLAVVKGLGGLMRATIN